MTYKEALKESRRVGAANAKGESHVAQAVYALSLVHAINPEILYNGAIKKNMTGDEVFKLTVFEISDLLFS